MPDASGNLLSSDPGYQAPGSGLINMNPSGNTVAPLPTPVVGYTPATANATAAASKSYDPSGVAVLDQDTVQGQLDKVLSQDSKLLQRADVRSRQEMAGKGLINTTMGRLDQASQGFGQRSRHHFSDGIRQSMDRFLVVIPTKRQSQIKRGKKHAHLFEHVCLINFFDLGLQFPIQMPEPM